MPAYPCCSYLYSGRLYLRRCLKAASMLLLCAFIGFVNQSFAQCYVPGQIVASSIQTNKVLLAWQDVNSAQIWEIELRVGNQPFTGAVTHLAANNPYQLTGLLASTLYRLRIRAVCPNGQKSSWNFFPFEFTTASFNPSACGLFFKIADDNCPDGNKFHLDVTNAGGNVLGGDVTLAAVKMIVRHTFLADLHLELVSPAGKVVKLFEEHGQSRDHLGNPADPTCIQVCRFSSADCEAINPIEHGGGYTNVFLPDENLHLFDDGSDPNGIWQLKICDDAKADTGSLRFLELEFAPIVCPQVYDIRVHAVGVDSAYLGWTFSGDCNDVIVEYGPPGFIPGTGYAAGPNGTILQIACSLDSVVLLDNLPSGSSFDVYVRTVCSGNQFAPNSCPVSFETACPVPSFQVYEEDFDGLSPCGNGCNCNNVYPLNSFWKNSTLHDDFDWLVRSGPASVAIQTGPLADISGTGNYLYLETLQPACQNGAFASLRSGCFKVEDPLGAECQLSFHYNMWGAAMGTLVLDASRNGGATWEPLWTLSGNQGSGWHELFVTLSAFIGDTIQLRFTGYTGPARTSQMAIDELKLYGVTILGEPDQVYYRDQDGDGYGDLLNLTVSCASTPPAGYVANATDCDDTNNVTYPGGEELPCNGVDENCNGLADDGIAPMPTIADVTICRGEEADLLVTSIPFGNIYWYTQSSGGEAFHIGFNYTSGPVDQQVTYYISDSSSIFSCASARRPVTILVKNSPQLVNPPPHNICLGDEIDLSSIAIIDLHFSGATLSYHESSPALASNKMTNYLVAPVYGDVFYVLATTTEGCKDEVPISFNIRDIPFVQIDLPSPLSLCAGKSVLLTTTISGGGKGPFSYGWSHGYSQSYAPVLAGINPGTIKYSITATDANGCKGRDDIDVITLASLAAVNINSTDVTTCNGSNGSITFSPVGGGMYDYSWSGPVSGNDWNKQGAFVLTGLKQGSYSVSITNSSTGCTFVNPVIVVNGPGPVVQNIVIQPESCPGLADGAIQISLGGPPASYNWSHGPASKDVFGLAAGDYSVTISGGACAYTLAGLTILPANPIVTGGIVTNPVCAGSPTGSVNLTLTGGSGGYSYLWSNGSITQDIQTLAPGNYWAIITDSKGCKVFTDTFVVVGPNPLDFAVTVQDLRCHGQNDGAIQLSAVGGTPPFSWFWADGPSTKDRNSLPAGNYRVTMTDVAGCKKSSDTILVSQPAPLIGTWDVVKNETCEGSKDGLLAVDISGGSAPWIYFWSFGVGDNLATNLKAGLYGLTVTDAKSCSVVLPELTLGYSAPLQTEIIQEVDPTCDFLANGKIITNVQGGFGVYQYFWSNGMTSSSPDHLISGTYSLTVNDISGCTSYLSGIILQEKSPLTIGLLGVSFPGCDSSSNGDIDITVSGQAPFTYFWSNGYNGQDPKMVVPGYYSVTVQDGHGCQQDLNSIPVLNTATNYQAVPIVVSQLQCSGDENGEIFIQVNGGEGPYQFNWSTGQEKDIEIGLDGISGLASGSYTVTITDNRGCVINYGPLTIVEPPPLTLTLPVDQIQNESCKDAKDGGITLEINGGVQPYTVFWFKDSLFYSAEASPQNLGPGKYTALVLDKNGCARSLNQAIEIIGPPSLLVWNEVNVEHASCVLLSTGGIELKLEGGVPEYAYSWSDGNTSRIRPLVQPGNYCVSVTDRFNCLIDTCFNVLGGTDPQILPTIYNECDPFSVVYLNVANGAAPYSFIWSHGETTPHLQNIPTGTYSVTVTDGQGCTASLDSIDVGHPILTIENIASLSASLGTMNGIAIVEPAGGTPPYSIQWDVNAKSQTTDTAFQLSPGWYCVLVTDVFNCFDTACIEVLLSTAVEEPYQHPGFRLYPNPASDVLTICTEEPNNNPDGPLTVSITAISGHKMTIGYLDQQKGLTSFSLANYPPGFYLLELMDTNGAILFFTKFVKIQGEF